MVSGRQCLQAGTAGVCVAGGRDRQVIAAVKCVPHARHARARKRKAVLRRTARGARRAPRVMQMQRAAGSARYARVPYVSGGTIKRRNICRERAPRARQARWR